jgi:hypothetical protein
VEEGMSKKYLREGGVWDLVLFVSKQVGNNEAEDVPGH